MGYGMTGKLCRKGFAKEYDVDNICFILSFVQIATGGSLPRCSEIIYICTDVTIPAGAQRWSECAGLIASVSAATLSMSRTHHRQGNTSTSSSSQLTEPHRGIVDNASAWKPRGRGFDSHTMFLF